MGFCDDLVVKNPLTKHETRVQSLGQEDPLEQEMATHPSWVSCLENPMDRGAWWATVHGVTKSQAGLSDWTTTIAVFNYCLSHGHLENLAITS